jgi:hypothetical protein
MSDMTDMTDADIAANWREDPLEETAPVRTGNFLRDRGYEDPDEIRFHRQGWPAETASPRKI